MSSDNTKLSSSVTVARYRELERANDRRALGDFVQERFDERYFRPIEDSRSKHGFALMAVACLVIETIESFYQGRADTRNASRKMFRDFFNRDTPLKVFGGVNDWFFEDLRCGLLHQGEARGGWRILRKGPLLDTKSRTINATQFLRELRKVVAEYANRLAADERCWEQFKTKMKAICGNCTERGSVVQPGLAVGVPQAVRR
ncbi:MAG: hypothetical protein HYY46_12375 [Deltaproteobacteria bacterium]|nr:hypothetical protein [Deltaproteobacteria bacterium]